MPAACATSEKAPVALAEMSIAGCATAVAAPSVERRKATCAASSAAISRAMRPMIGSAKLTCRPPVTAPWVPVPVSKVAARPVPLTA